MSQLSGVSGRTLRYYDAIGLLMPHEISAAGYRKYSQVEINRLQQILLYKEMGLKLAEIDLNRKVLADIAVNDAVAFTALTDQVKKALDA